MTGTNPMYTQPATADTIDYKPLALLAVAGLAFSIVYGVVLVVTAVAALFKGEPFFLPGWMLMLAIAGVLLSAAALWQIHNSEGTRAGTKLAKWGLWLGIILGLCYTTYHTTTGIAIVSQANDFMLDKENGFFYLLQGDARKVKTAFLCTLSWNERVGAHVDNDRDMQRYDQALPQNPRGRLTGFLECPLVRAFTQAPPGSITVEALSVRDWTFENRAYKIERKYRIKTEEAEYEVPFLITSLEAEVEGEKRKWKVEWGFNLPLQPIMRTPLGQKRVGIRQRSFEFLADNKTGWFPYLRNRRGLEFFLATQRPSERARLRAEISAIKEGTLLLAVAGPAAPVLDSKSTETLLKKFLPEYKGLSDVLEVFTTDKLRFPAKPEWMPKVHAALARTFEPDKLSLLSAKMQLDEQAPVKAKDGLLYVTHEVEIPIYVGETGGKFDVAVVGKVVVTASDNFDPSVPNADQQWQVHSAEFTRAVPIASKQ
jgi:hypothetical protein